MKGKVLSLKIVLTTLAFFVASICFCVDVLPKKEKTIYAIESTKVVLGGSGNRNEYSALFKGSESTQDDDIIFSAEKVKIDNTYNADTVGIQTFQGAYNEETKEYKNYYYKDISSNEGALKKTVVDNGEFVVLKNEINNSGNVVGKGGSNEVEAVLVSFGAYVYIPPKTDDVGNITSQEDVKIATDNNIIANKDVTAEQKYYTKVTYLEVALEKDGVAQQDAKLETRNITPNEGGLFFDFVYLIEQQSNNSNEGHYKFTFKYMILNVEFVEEFEFYIVNEVSYTGVLEEKKGYNATPTLGWTSDNEFEHTASSTGGYVAYSLGNMQMADDTISYPSITYDYTKYKLKYTHTSNQKNSVHDFTCVYDNKLLDTKAQLNYTITTNGTTVEQQPIELNDFNKNSSINLITIILTEPGTYVVEYDFIYDGYKAETTPNLDISKKEIRLSISGLKANYSKTDYEGARLQYLELASKVGNNVDLFVPNGYNIKSDISNLKDSELGFVYSLVENDMREGDAIATNSIDSLINEQLKDISLTDENAFDFLVTDTGVITEIGGISLSNYHNLETVLNNISYAETNQGSLWINGNDSYDESSFYYYSPTKITVDSLYNLTKEKDEISGTEKVTKIERKENSDDIKRNFTNKTSFNKKGYYLVFIKVKPQDGTNTYWQIFAMQYTSSSVDINVEAIDIKNSADTTDDTYEIVAGGKYTNKNVRVSWKKPGVFDRNIKGYYFSMLNNNASREDLLSTSKISLNVSEITIEDTLYLSTNLGSDVEHGNFVKYLIRLESEGEGATHKIFTIDRQDISGVQPFLIEEKNSGNSIFYSYATDKFNNQIPIINSITDSYATLRWDDKASGAETFASYSYTPFVQNSQKSVKLTGNSNASWITTNYELGNTIVGSSLNKASSIYNVGSDCILFNQGVYIIRIWDSAGNECYYAFVIDRTENYFEIENLCLTNASVIYGDNVSYSIGDYKAFQISVSEENNELSEFVEAVSKKSLATYKDGLYYQGSNNNVNIITDYFQKQGDNYYFTIKNNKVVGYDTEKKQDSLIGGTRGELVYYDDDGASYYKRTLYAVGANQTYTTKEITDGAFVVVEINKDNARGMAYYSNNVIDKTNIPADGLSSDAVKRYEMTGSDQFDENNNEIASGMNKAHAVDANHVAFVWNMGTGNFEVAEVYYTFYTLKPIQFNSKDNGKYYFYGSAEDKQYIYNNGWLDGKDYSLGDGRALYSFNGENDSRAGLYVVTRIYKQTETSDFGDDVLEKNYYFIVDRNGIIDTVQKIGNYIKIQLLENETDFNNFSMSGTETGTLTSTNERYNIYLTTTKLPATLQVPVGKYFTEADPDKNIPQYSSDGYYSGKLNVSVYFQDNIYGQLFDQYKNATDIKIFDSEIEITKDGYFVIDIYKYLTDVNQALRDRITVSDTNGNWMFLSGDYVIRISDNVTNPLAKTHTKLIAFRIKGFDDLGPQTDSYTGYNEEDMAKINVSITEKFNYTATVSQEFLHVEIPSYNKDVYEKAQVDPSYVVVEQYYGENASPIYYINHPYEQKNGINLFENSDYVKVIENDDKSIKSTLLRLDTKLRTKTGEIDLENLNTPLYYIVTIRYKIGDGDIDEKYQECYVRYNSNGTKEYYYQAKYKIVIDREAPKANIEELNKSDAFVEEYNALFETESMISNGVHPTSSNLYFTKQYSKYYDEKKINQNINQGYIYAYQVFANTEFKTDDVKKVYYTPISALATYNLTLPLINTNIYTTKDLTKVTLNTYAGLGLSNNAYYEIIEQDSAGNTTQYVIHYEPSISDVSMEIPVELNQTDGKKDTFTIGFGNHTETNSQFNIYDLNATGSSSAQGELFFKVALEKANSGEILTVLTTSKTEFSKINQQIVEKIKTEQYGMFSLKISVRCARSEENPKGISTKTTNINLYDKNDVEEINIERLVYDGNGNKYVNAETGEIYINLHGANSYDNEKNVWYFATQITIKTAESETIYKGEIINGNVVYKINGVGDNRQVVCEENTIYYITMVDFLGKTSNYRFNASGRYFYKVSFENPNEEGAFGDSYMEINKIYYGYTTALIEFDKIFTAKFYTIVNGQPQQQNLKLGEEKDGYNTIYIIANYDNGGSISEYRIDILEGQTLEISYYITIDTRLSNVALRDYNSGEQRGIIWTFPNTLYTDESARAEQSGTGIMNLLWDAPAENDYFDYVYTLHELMKDGTYRDFDLTTSTAYVISTTTESQGIYKLEIQVYGKNGKYLGNKIFAFEVQEVSTQIYYVRNNNGELVKANSTFMASDLSDLPKWETEKTSYPINENISLPLYITNQELSVVITAVDVKPYSVVLTTTAHNYTFTLYKLEKENSYTIYLGILRVSETEELLDYNLNITNVNEPVTNSTSFTVAGKPDDEIKIQTVLTNSNDKLLSKNLLNIEIRYNDEFVTAEVFNGTYVIDGNGQYSFTFKDLAGNVHKFKNQSTSLDIYVLREVVVMVNDKAPIANAFYNNEVSVAIYASTKYVTGSISIEAYKNGEPYSVEGSSSFVFKDYGTYRITIKASYDDGVSEEPIGLEKVITFTIVNVKEARKSIDLTSLNGSEITKVLNTYGEDKTKEFLAMINSSNGGMNITYENVIKNAKDLNVTAGKTTFTITYVVNKDNYKYPPRTVDFSFTLNNETPTIECSLAKGDSTTKKFDIYFNAAILYEQIGEAYIYINDEIVAHIDENSANSEVSITTSFKQNGDGDYYIKLVGTSGVVWDSFKVTIKEPLNFWAIIVILVIVGVVATVVITIIVLRRKMRIR